MTSDPQQPVPDEDVDTEALDRARATIEDARGDVHDAMSYSAPAEDMELPGAGQAADSGEDEEVTPRPI
jgi:hypothetical protein